MLAKNYSFSIKMSTRIKRLSFEMLYCKGKSKNEDYRKEELKTGGSDTSIRHAFGGHAGMIQKQETQALCLK